MRSLTLFLCILAMLAAGVSAMLYAWIGSDSDQLRREVDGLRASLSLAKQGTLDVDEARAALEARAAALERELNELKARNVSLEARNSQLARDVTQARDELLEKQRGEMMSSQEIIDLRRQLVDAKSALAAAASGASTEQIASYESRIADLEAQLGFLRRTREGEPSLAGVPADLKGAVLEVGPKAAFVILNIGSRNGAAPTLEMVLRRGSTVIARVRLTDVRESYSVAHVLPSPGAGTIRAGDVATRS